MENPTLRLKIDSKTESIAFLPSNRGGGIADAQCMRARERADAEALVDRQRYVSIPNASRCGRKGVGKDSVAEVRVSSRVRYGVHIGADLRRAGVGLTVLDEYRRTTVVGPFWKRAVLVRTDVFGCE